MTDLEYGIRITAGYLMILWFAYHIMVRVISSVRFWWTEEPDFYHPDTKEEP